MKLKVLLGALAWTLLITAMHLQLNVGWERVKATLLGRNEMVVGFLPVT